SREAPPVSLRARHRARGTRRRSPLRSCPTRSATEAQRSRPVRRWPPGREFPGSLRFVRRPAAALHALDQMIDRLADREIENLAVECRVVTCRAAETQHFAVAQRIFAGTGGGVDDLRGHDVDDIQGDLRIGHLLLAFTENAKELGVARLLAAEFDD